MLVTLPLEKHRVNSSDDEMNQDAYDVLDLKALKCFWEMARSGSLTQAGISLGISEAAVSQRIRKLEGYLGVKLYEARGGKVRLSNLKSVNCLFNRNHRCRSIRYTACQRWSNRRRFQPE